MKDYFYNKNYLAIYLHNIFDTFAKSVVSIFGVILLYKIGFPIWLILLFYAFQFGFMGLLSPLSPILVSKIGLVKSILISNIFRIIGTCFLLLVHDFSSVYLFLIFIFFSLDGAIYHPLIDGVISNYTDDKHKGKVNTLNTIFKSLSIILATFIGGYLVGSGNNFLLLIFIILSFIFSSLSYFLLLDKKEQKYDYKFGDIFKYLYSTNFKSNIIPFSFESFYIIERIFIPLFIFVAIPDFKVVSYIIGFATLFEFIVLFFFGKAIDKFTHKSFFLSTLLKSINSIFFIFQNIHFGFIFLNQIYFNITEDMYGSSFGTLLQKKAKKESDPILFTTAEEMVLCFAEFFVLIFFSILAYFIGNIIFIIIFSSAFIAVWGIYKTWSK